MRNIGRLHRPNITLLSEAPLITCTDAVSAKVDVLMPTGRSQLMASEQLGRSGLLAPMHVHQPGFDCADARIDD